MLTLILITKVDYLNLTREFRVEQVMAIFISKLKMIIEANTKLEHCTMSVGSFMTDIERRAMINSAKIAGVTNLSLINETTAVALTYAYNNSESIENNKKPFLCVFVDMGYAQTQASLVEFRKDKVKIISTNFDANLGGRDFDRVLCDFFQKEFLTKYNVDACSNPRALLRLRAECEKLKKRLSSITSASPLNIECFMNDIDVSGKINREEFEKLSDGLLDKFRNLLKDLIVETSKKTLNY